MPSHTAASRAGRCASCRGSDDADCTTVADHADADALGAIFGKIDSVEQIPAALKVYELVRKARAEAIVEGASASGRTLHRASTRLSARTDSAVSDESAADRDAAFAKLKTESVASRRGETY